MTQIALLIRPEPNGISAYCALHGTRESTSDRRAAANFRLFPRLRIGLPLAGLERAEQLLLGEGLIVNCENPKVPRERDLRLEENQTA